MSSLLHSTWPLSAVVGADHGLADDRLHTSLVSGVVPLLITDGARSSLRCSHYRFPLVKTLDCLNLERTLKPWQCVAGTAPQAAMKKGRC